MCEGSLRSGSERDCLNAAKTPCDASVRCSWVGERGADPVAFEHAFDQALLSLGFAGHMRHYDLNLYAMADPRTGIALHQLRYRFVNCDFGPSAQPHTRRVRERDLFLAGSQRGTSGCLPHARCSRGCQNPQVWEAGGSEWTRRLVRATTK